MSTEQDKPGFVTHLWRRPRHRWMLGLPAGAILAFVLGGLAIAALDGVVSYTNRTEFCISCHEMEQTVYQEYMESAHFSNPSGVQAQCADCHVPRDFIPKMVRKVRAAAEVWHKLVGTIDTPDKFEARRDTLAQRVWAEMRASDSRNCRNCHTQERMDLSRQEDSAARKHSADHRKQTGETCIDCHQGLVHELPKVY